MILIIGIGSQSEVIEEIFYSNNIYDLYLASYDDIICKKSNFIGNVFNIKNIEEYNCIIGIGDNKLRYEIYKKLYEFNKNINYINAIHKNTYISKNIKLGIGNVICSGTSIGTLCELGNHNIINTNSSIDHHCNISDFIHITPNCALCGKVKIHTGCFIGVGSNIIPNITIKPWCFYKSHSLIKESMDKIPIYQPYLKDCLNSVRDAIESGWISSKGIFINKSIELLKNKLNAKYILLVSNGTMATHCIFMALKYKYPSINKIYIPNHVYVAAINSALMEYKIENLELMKFNIDTYNIVTDTSYINTLEKNSAVLIVHNIGNIINVPRLKKLRPDLIFIEDNCEGFLGKYDNIYTGIGEHTLCSSVSFFANKTITSGEGGAIFTNDKDVYDYLSKKINQGNTKTKYLHDIHAYNYRMTNIQAAILYDQLCIFDFIHDSKKNIFNIYKKELKDFVILPKIEDNTTPSYWMFSIRIPNSNYNDNENYMNKNGIEIRPFFYPLHLNDHLKSLVDINLNQQYKEIFMIPSYCILSLNEQYYIIDTIKNLNKLYNN